MTVALEQRRRRGLEGESARDSRAESPLGRLLLTGRLSATEWRAGERLRVSRAAFLAELGRSVLLSDFVAGAEHVAASPGPQALRSPGASMVANTLRSEDADKPIKRLSDLPETPAERRERTLAQWAEAKKTALVAVGGSRAGLSLLLRVACELVEPTDAGEIVVVRMALRRLARRWGFEEEAGKKGDPGLRALRLSLEGREAWRFPKGKNRMAAE